jgi:hypothetical protein
MKDVLFVAHILGLDDVVEDGDILAIFERPIDAVAANSLSVGQLEVDFAVETGHGHLQVRDTTGGTSERGSTRNLAHLPLGPSGPPLLHHPHANRPSLPTTLPLIRNQNTAAAKGRVIVATHHNQSNFSPSANKDRASKSVRDVTRQKTTRSAICIL